MAIRFPGADRVVRPYNETGKVSEKSPALGLNRPGAVAGICMSRIQVLIRQKCPHLQGKGFQNLGFGGVFWALFAAVGKKRPAGGSPWKGECPVGKHRKRMIVSLKPTYERIGDSTI